MIVCLSSDLRGAVVRGGSRELESRELRKTPVDIAEIGNSDPVQPVALNPLRAADVAISRNPIANTDAGHCTDDVIRS